MDKVIQVAPIQTEDAQKANEEAVVLHNEAQEIVISNQPEYDIAGTLLQRVKGKAKEIEAKRKEITRPLDVAKKAVMDLFRSPLIKLGEAEINIKRGLLNFDEIRERLRKEQEEKLRKQAEAEETRKKKALEERAKKAEAKGNAEKAEELREQKEDVHVEAPILAPRVETPKGISYQTKWTAEVVDFTALPDTYKLPNMPMLHKTAQAQKGKVPITGVRFSSQKIASSRSI